METKLEAIPGTFHPGTPSRMKEHISKYLYTKFGALFQSVTIWPKIGLNRLHYKGNADTTQGGLQSTF